MDHLMDCFPISMPQNNQLQLMEQTRQNAITDMIRQRHWCVSDASWEQFNQERSGGPVPS